MGAGTPKQFLELDGLPLVVFTLRRLAECTLLSHFYVATLPEEVAGLERRLGQEKLGRPVRVLRGGATRQESVARALAEVPADADLVLVHDAVRPLINREQTERVIEQAEACGAAILGVPATDTIKEVKRASLPKDVALITATIHRERIVMAQTPQVFRTALLKEAFARAAQDGMTASDESALVERLGHEVRVVQGSERNLKVTRPGDLELAQFYLQQERHVSHAK
jgi:2-C-methyl-D-erythritol 4-phosphate cytidylyltransferase